MPDCNYQIGRPKGPQSTIGKNWMRRLALIFVVICFSNSAFAQHYYGRFLDRLSVTMNIDNSVEWNTITLLTDFRFEDPSRRLWTAPEGYTSNGASIPRVFWSRIGAPYTGRYVPAAVIHDYYVFRKTRTARATHRNFYNGMRAKHVHPVKAYLMYWAVVLYRDWEIGQPETYRSLEASNLDAERQLAEIMPFIKQYLEENFGDYDLDFIEQDAVRFREALTGEISPLHYDGMGREHGIPSVLQSIEDGEFNFNFIEGEIEPPQFDLLPDRWLDQTMLGAPIGLEFVLKVDLEELQDSRPPYFADMENDQFVIVREQNPCEWTHGTIGNELSTGIATVIGDILDSSQPSPHLMVELHHDPEILQSLRERLGNVTAGADINIVAQGQAVSLDGTEFFQAPENNLENLKNYSHGTIMSGEITDDGMFTIRSRAYISATPGQPSILSWPCVD